MSLNDEYDLWWSVLTWLLSQYTLTYVTMSPPNSRWSSLVFFLCVIAFVSCMFIFFLFFLKKLHLDLSVSSLFSLFLFCIFCIQFLANPSGNSLQIFVRSYMSSELRWQVFFSVWTRFHRLVIFGPTESFRYHRNMPLGATDFAIRKTVCHLLYISSDPAPLNESCPLQASQFHPLLCAESQGPNLYDEFQKALLGNWCQRGRERSHQSSRGRESLKDPRCC